jgi:transposase
LLDEQIGKLDQMIATALQRHQEAVVRVAAIPGFGADSAQQLIAEVGADAEAFPSAGDFTSWAGLCPGSNVTAEQNHSSRSAKGNRFVRRILTQAAQAAVKTKGSSFQLLFRRFLPRLHYTGAVWAIAHRLGRLVWKILHHGVSYIEHGEQPTPAANKRRVQKMLKVLRTLGYAVAITPIPEPGRG